MAALPFPGPTLKIHSLAPASEAHVGMDHFRGLTMEGEDAGSWRVTAPPVQATELDPDHSSSTAGSRAHSLASVFSTEKWTM